MNFKRFLTSTQGLLCVSLTFSPFPALASAGEGAAGFQSILYPLINFFIFFGLLSVILKKPIVRAWELRREALGERLTRADSILAEAKQTLLAAQAEQEGVQAEIHKLKQEILAHTEQEVREIEAHSLERIEAIKKETAQKILIQEKTILNEIYSSVVEEVMVLTRAALADRLDSSKDHKTTMERFAALETSKLNQFINTTRGES
jgi:F0F1-type ATP synthase membrane subunit b/b'